jgi:uncharacterized membrane protein
LTVTTDQLTLILGMAIVLFVTRIAGIFLARHLPDSPRMKMMLGVLPGITMVSIILPDVVNAGSAGILAGIAVFIAIRITGNLGVAMIVGVGIVTVLG